MYSMVDKSKKKKNRGSKPSTTVTVSQCVTVVHRETNRQKTPEPGVAHTQHVAYIVTYWTLLCDLSEHVVVVFLTGGGRRGGEGGGGHKHLTSTRTKAQNKC